MILVLLGLRLWQLQIRDGFHYQELARDNRTRSIELVPARGLLYDRKGELLANNVPSFQLYVSLRRCSRRRLRNHTFAPVRECGFGDHFNQTL